MIHLRGLVQQDEEISFRPNDSPAAFVGVFILMVFAFFGVSLTQRCGRLKTRFNENPSPSLKYVVKDENEEKIPVSVQAKQKLVITFKNGVISSRNVLKKTTSVLYSLREKKFDEFEGLELDQNQNGRRLKRQTNDLVDASNSARARARESLFENYLAFQTNDSRVVSSLSNVLGTKFSATGDRNGKKSSLAETLSTLGRDLGAKHICAYKSGITGNDQDRQRKVQATCSRTSKISSRKDSHFHFQARRKKTIAFRRSRSKLAVENVCLVLNDEVLTVAEIEILNRFNALQETESAELEIPEIHLEPYLLRLVNGLNRWFSHDGEIGDESIGIRCLFLSVFYLRKIKKSVPAFTLSEYNVHRIMAVLMLICAKFTEDDIISNKFWGDISGLSLAEVNELEEDLCFSSGFDFQINQEELKATYKEFNFHDLPLVRRIASHNATVISGSPQLALIASRRL